MKHAWRKLVHCFCGASPSTNTQHALEGPAVRLPSVLVSEEFISNTIPVQVAEPTKIQDCDTPLSLNTPPQSAKDEIHAAPGLGGDSIEQHQFNTSGNGHCADSGCHHGDHNCSGTDSGQDDTVCTEPRVSPRPSNRAVTGRPDSRGPPPEAAIGATTNQETTLPETALPETALPEAASGATVREDDTGITDKDL